MATALSFPVNDVGRDFVVGDIHGHFDVLERELWAIGFNASCDRLFSVGDLIDRGPFSCRCLEFLNEPWFHAVSGNHEQMAIEYYFGSIDQDIYRRNGGQWFIDLAPNSRSRSKQEKYVLAFSGLPTIIDVQTDRGLIGIVHAQCPTAAWDELKSGLQDPNAASYFTERCHWERKIVHDHNALPVHGVAKVYSGHTIVKEVTTRGNHRFIDLSCYHTGRLHIEQIHGGK